MSSTKDAATRPAAQQRPQAVHQKLEDDGAESTKAEAEDNDDNNGKKKKCKPCRCTGPCFVDYLLKYQIPLMLAVAIVFGYLVPAPGQWIADQGVPLGSVFVVRLVYRFAFRCLRRFGVAAVVAASTLCKLFVALSNDTNTKTFRACFCGCVHSLVGGRLSSSWYPA